MGQAVEKYLKHYSETADLDTDFVDSLAPRHQALVIPAYKESGAFVENLANHPKAAETLLICVVNEPQSNRKNPLNAKLIAELENHATVHFSHGVFRILQLGTLQILLILKVDADALPDTQGVGLARKLGSDVACLLYQHKKIMRPWIFSSDADATLPATHFDIVEDIEVSAICHPFRHVGSDSIVLTATLLYEKCLRYYRNQLSRAGSPYAFFTLGSVITLSMNHYMQARGFPKRSGAEDFYLLNKLAKLGKVVEQGDEVLISARLSDRVPFGTGPAVKEIIDKLQRNEPVQYYSPRAFLALKQFIEAVPEIWEAPALDLKQLLPDPIVKVLQDADFDHFLNKRRHQDKSLAQFERSFHNWFDAFQTMKFIRRLQHFYDDVEIEAVSEGLFYNKANKTIANQ